MNVNKFDASNIESAIADTRAKIERKKRLEWNEKQIFASMKSIASSLKDIYDNELWKDSFETWDEYCKTRLHLTRQRAHQLINAEDTRLLLSDDPQVGAVAKELNDGQATALNGISKEQAVEILHEAIKRPGKMTAAKIKAAKARVIEPAPPVAEPTLDDEP